MASPRSHDKSQAVASKQPEAELDLDVALVRELLSRQHPDLSALALEPAVNGWDNVTFRLGSELAVRLPRRAIAHDLLITEQRWLPEIAQRVSLPIPTPVRIGKPCDLYPWAWSVVPWITGKPAAEQPLDSSESDRLGRFLSQLHTPAPSDAPSNPYRGVPLHCRADAFATRRRHLDDVAIDAEDLGDIDFGLLDELWARALEAPVGDRSVWLHGDLHPKNLLVDEQGRLAAVIDWGDLTAGDPATDLAAVWMQFPTESHDRFWQAYPDSSPELLSRARGWAALFGVLLLDIGLDDDAAFARIGRATLARLCEQGVSPL